jgi:hypothetical protein
MSFIDYNALKTNIGVWLAREGDTTLATYAADFITLFECAAQRRLKVRPQETTATLTPTSGVATLPSDYLGYRRVTWTGSPNHDLDYVAPNVWSTLYPADIGASIPVVFTIEGSKLRVAPSDDTSLTFDYFQRTPALSAGLNWLYTNHPDAYLFGSLAEATMFNRALDQAGAWKARRDEVFQEIAMLDFNERQGMAVRVVGCTP